MRAGTRGRPGKRGSRAGAENRVDRRRAAATTHADQSGVTPGWAEGSRGQQGTAYRETGSAQIRLVAGEPAMPENNAQAGLPPEPAAGTNGGVPGTGARPGPSTSLRPGNPAGSRSVLEPVRTDNRGGVGSPGPYSAHRACVRASAAEPLLSESPTPCRWWAGAGACRSNGSERMRRPSSGIAPSSVAAAVKPSEPALDSEVADR